MMNPFEFFRTRIGAMISQGFVVDTVRANLDLKGASEVWGGPDTDDRAAWYFWLTNTPGAYRLRLMHAETLDGAGSAALRGAFSVKYYPSRHEPVYRHFSRREQALIDSDVFDETNTPRVEALPGIPEALFGIGSIEFTHDPLCGQTFLTYSSLNRMRFRSRASGLCELPTWDVGYPLFDALAGLQAFLSRRAPKRVVLSRQPGFEFIEAADGHIDDTDSALAELRSLLVAFFPEDSAARSTVEATVTARHVAEPWMTLVDIAPHRSGGHEHGHDHGHGAACHAESAHDHGPCACGDRHTHAPSVHTIRMGDVDWTVPLAFNDQWWALAEADRSVPTMPCGCH